MTTFLPPRHLNVVPHSSAERGCPCSRVEELTEPLSGCSNHSRLTRSGETVSVKLDKQFYRRAESLCQKPTCHNSVCKAVWPWLPCWVLIRTAQTYRCVFHLRPHPSFVVVVGFGHNSLGREQETGERLPGHRAQKRETAPRCQLCLLESAGGVLGLTLKNRHLVLLDFKVERTLTPTPCQILVPPGVS